MKLALFNKASINRLYYLMLIVVAFTLPLPRLFNNISIIILGVVWLLSGVFCSNWKRVLSNKLFWAHSCIYFLYIIGVSYSENFPEALFVLEKTLPLLLLPLIIFNFKSISKNQLFSILKAFISGVVLICIIGITYAYYKKYYLENLSFVEENNFFIDISHLFMPYIYFGYYLVVSIYIIAYLLVNEKVTVFSRTIYVVLIIFFLFLVSVSVGFLSLVILILTSSGLILLKYKKSKIKAVSIILLIITIPVLLILFGSNQNAKQRIIQRTTISFENVENNKYNYSSTRVGPLLISLQVAKENWLTGVGTGDTPDIMAIKYKQNKLDQLIGYNSHNQYIDLLITLGVPGIAALIFNIFYPLYLAYRSKSYLYLCFILFFCISFLTENVLATNKGVILYAFIGAILASSMQGENKVHFRLS